MNGQVVGMNYWVQDVERNISAKTSDDCANSPRGTQKSFVFNLDVDFPKNLNAKNNCEGEIEKEMIKQIPECFDSDAVCFHNIKLCQCLPRECKL